MVKRGKINLNIGGNNRTTKPLSRFIYVIKHQAYMKVLSKSPTLRYVLAAFATPLLATGMTIWGFSGYAVYLPGRPWRVDHNSGQTVLALTIFFLLIAGWPIMLCVMMPFVKAMRRRRKTKLAYFLLAGFVTGVVISSAYFPIIFSWRDAKAFFYPTVTASTLTMFLVWMTCIVGDPDYPFDKSEEVVHEEK